MKIENIVKERKQRGLKPLRRVRPPRSVYPHGIERRYERFLSGLLKEIDDEIAKVYTIIPMALKEWELLTRNDSFVDQFSRFFDNIKQLASLKIAQATPVIEDFAFETQEWNRKDFSRVVNSVLGVNVIASEPWLKPKMDVFVKQNVEYITKLMTDDVNTIQAIVQNGVVTQTSTRNLTAEIKKKMNMSENRAELIARDQIGKYNGQLTQLRQQNLGGKKYIWRTSKDERVRTLHQNRDGQVFSWDNPPDETDDDGHPGEPIQCRCYAEMIFDEDDDE
jgi:SPP1 gp7 family putative phage head morphogenesis protein